MFKKISKIVMGVFNFNQDDSAQEGKNQAVIFGKINIIYGHNYSGKTTLAKIFRALETGILPLRYRPKIEFSIESDNGNTISQDSIDQQEYAVRVFNVDFIKENLSFIVNEEGDISSFAVFGEKNKKIEKEIEGIKFELGSEEGETGLYKDVKNATQTLGISNKTAQAAEGQLYEKLQEKARKMKGDSAIFGVTVYHINNIKDDIKVVDRDDYQGIDEKQREEYKNLLRDYVQGKVSEISPVNLQFDFIVSEAESLITKNIIISNPIQELLTNHLLEKWVLDGRDLHDKREKCGFCGQSLSADIKARIDGHFNKESGYLISQIDQLIVKIEKEKKHTKNFFPNIQADKFYSKFKDSVNKILSESQNESQHYVDALDDLQNQIENRKKSISRSLEFQLPESNVQNINKLHKDMEELIKENEQYGSNLTKKKKYAQYALRLDEVQKFLGDISYKDQIQNIVNLNQKVTDDKGIYGRKGGEIRKKEERIEELQNQLIDESAGAKKIDDLLKNYFGHRYLSLDAIKNKDTRIYKFEIMRGSEKAYNLSEGEKNLIAFCYFIAKLDDVTTKDSNPIIWIDDPVSSLDSNHIFFIFSLIREKIVSLKQYKQLFISTHNIEFMGHLKNELLRYNVQFFFIEKIREFSQIVVMPSHMKNNMTEFSYSFHQIYKCAHADSSDQDVFHDFPNNARKFMEIFLCHLHPNIKSLPDKLRVFLGEDVISSTIISKINNTYSHGVIGRSIEADIPQMIDEAKFILDKIQKNNPEQYNALLESIKDSS